MGGHLHGRKTVNAAKYAVRALALLALCAASRLYADEIRYKPLGFAGMERKEVKALRVKYLTTHRKWLSETLDSGEVYRIYVRKELEKRKMPFILEYLPVVESNYSPKARSKSGALGMWQFMLNSVKPYLICNEYVDERLDPWKSTHAALSKLQENYDMFGDWLLAIAAYNCGAGKMRKVLKQTDRKDFWELCDENLLSAQVRQYIPKLLAVADVAENAAYYGTPLPTARDAHGQSVPIPADSFDYLPVNKAVSLSALASALRIDESMLTELNLALLSGVTPPAAEYRIRLPEGLGLTAHYALLCIDTFHR